MMETRPRLILGLESQPPRVHIRLDGNRGAEVVWLQLRALYGDGEVKGDCLTIGVDSFLALTEPLATLCRRYRVRFVPDEGVRSLLGDVQALGRELDEAYGAVNEITEQELFVRLQGGRFIRRLTDFQIRDLRKLLWLPHGANFSVPGAGKTTVTFATYEAERSADRVNRLLVVGPLSALDSWISEARECFSEPPVMDIFDGSVNWDSEVVLINYQRLAIAYQAVSQWIGAGDTHLVLDEAHRIKRGWDGKWGRACLNLGFLARRRDVLTGTPAPQSPYDLLALVDFLWPKAGRNRLPRPQTLKTKNPSVVAAVSNAVRPLYVRTRKAELGLREPQLNGVRVRLTDLHRDVYEAVRNRYAGVFAMAPSEKTSLARLGKVVMYLIEAATNPALLVAGSSRLDPIVFRHPPLELPEEGRLVDLLREYSSYETPAKFKTLATIVEDGVSRGRKMLIWTNFVRNIVTMEKMFQRYKPAIIHGGIPAFARNHHERSRSGELARFRQNEECMVMIANPAAAGEGVSLHQVCHDAVYLDRTFNAGQYLQSVDRIHRLGLPDWTDTRITLLITEDTIDEVIDHRVRDKVRHLGTILDDPDIVTMALPDEEEYGAPMDDDADVTALFQHLRGGNGGA